IALSLFRQRLAAERVRLYCAKRTGPRENRTKRFRPQRPSAAHAVNICLIPSQYFPFLAIRINNPDQVRSTLLIASGRKLRTAPERQREWKWKFKRPVRRKKRSRIGLLEPRRGYPRHSLLQAYRRCG